MNTSSSIRQFFGRRSRGLSERQMSQPCRSSNRRRRRVAAARRGRHLRQHQLRHESLEQRLALAVSVFEQGGYLSGSVGQVAPTSNPGHLLILGSQGEEVFVQQTATSPQSLLVADNPSFLNALFVQDVDSRFDRIVCTSGELRSDVGVQQDNDVVYAFSPDGRTVTTRFVFPLNSRFDLPTGAPPGVANLGVLRLRQSDGAVTEWGLRSNGGAVSIVSGPGIITPAQAGYVVPSSPQVDVLDRNFSVSSANLDLISLQVSWLIPQSVRSDTNVSPFAEAPTFDCFRSGYGLLYPSAFSQPNFTLPSALGNGSNGIIPGSVVGELSLNGRRFPFRSAGFDSTQLVFSGGTAQVGFNPVLAIQTPNLFGLDRYFLCVQGTVDPFQGTISLQVFGSFSAQGAYVTGTMDPGPVRLDVEYAVSLQGNGVDGAAGGFTFFAGQDITRQVYVDLPTPGATVNVESPLLMATALVDGDTTFRATNVNIRAQMSVNDRLDIGPSLMTRSDANARIIPANTDAFQEVIETRLDRSEPNFVRTAGAVAEIVGGEVVGLFTPAGQFGAGYDNDEPPVVTIRGPNGEINAVLGAVEIDRDPDSGTYGQVVGVEIVAAGFGYDNVPPYSSAQPQITISPPPAGTGRQATATAVLDADGRVVGVTIDDPGDYRDVPDPVATIAQPQAMYRAEIDAFGRIGRYIRTHAGFGYTSRPPVVVEPPRQTGGAAAQVAAIDETDGGITEIVVTQGGYGYTSAPQVWVAPPPRETGGAQARAIAVVDDLGRVTEIVILDAGRGYVDPPVVEIRGPIPVGCVETVNLDSSIAATIFDVRIADELATQGVMRGSLNVSPSGSISGAFGASKAADSVFILAQSSDVIVEGKIWGTNQTYLMQSTERDAELAPFRLTTAARATEIDTGLIIGADVAITLANDAPTPAPTPVGDNAIAFNTVRLQTNIDSLRVKASTRDGLDRREPFPYELRIDDIDTDTKGSVSVDAVAASSFPISIAVASNMRFTAALDTAGDVSLAAQRRLSVSSPVSTTRGRISISGDDIAILNSLRVTDADADDSRDDIVLNAEAGTMTIGGLLSAKNNVSLVQKNRTEDVVSSYSNSDSLFIPNSSTVTQSITVTDTFTFDDIDVRVDIKHPRVSDLSGVLIAPGGEQFVLFNRPGLGVIPPPGAVTADLTGTIFDSEAVPAVTLAGGTPPYTGRFRPIDAFTPLYGESVLGTWQLRITDSAPTQSGTLENFEILFTSKANQQGGITGAARVIADRLAIDADGYVGTPSLLPSNSAFFLQTDINTLEARVGGSIAIDEMSDLYAESIRAGGLVSLRARGVDPVKFGGEHVSAVRGNLIDVPQIDVSAPNGSIDIQNNAPKTIIVGNSEALRRGGAVSMQAAGNAVIRSTGGASFGDLFVLDGPVAGDGARAVRGLVSMLPSSSYNPGIPGVFASSLKATVNGRLAIPGMALRVGDRLLLNIDSSPNAANGVYAVTSLGSTGSPWVLTRAADSDTAAETPSNTFVRVTDGPAKGKVFQMTYTSTESVPFTRASLGVTETPVITNIGSDDARDKTTFVVSTGGGTNTAAGSLGKMLRLLQTNDTSGSANPVQEMGFTFSSQLLTPIQLTEELPAITKRITIDGNTSFNPPGSPPNSRPRILVDGSRVLRTREGVAVTTSAVVNGFDFSTAGASESILANMTIAGFSRGAAVRVTDVDAMVLNGLTLGTAVNNIRVTNAYGAQVAGSSQGTSIVGNSITASTKAGIRLQDNVTGTVIVGNAIGAGDRDNSVGIEVDATGTNRIGVLPVAPLSTLPPVTATRVSDTAFTLPSSFNLDAVGLFPGLGVRGTRLAVTDGSAAVRISSVATDAITGVTTVTITGGRITANGSVTFGHFVRTVENTSNVTLPAAISVNQVYVGQIVRGTGVSGIPVNARVTKVVTDAAGVVTLTLSSPLIASGVTALTFGVPPRNTVLGNLTGIVLARGTTVINSTTINSNTFDGIRITGGTNTIGSVSTRASSSNVVVGNGGFGIVAVHSGSRAAAEVVANQQTIRGNYLGVTPTDKAIARRNGKGNIGIRYQTPVVESVYAGLGNKYVPNRVTLVDLEGNEHSGTPEIDDGPDDPKPPPPPRSGSPARRGVPPFPPKRR